MANDDFSPAEQDSSAPDTTAPEPYAPGKLWGEHGQRSSAAESADAGLRTDEAATDGLPMESVVIDDIDESDIEDIVGALPTDTDEPAVRGPIFHPVSADGAFNAASNADLPPGEGVLGLPTDEATDAPITDSLTDAHSTGVHDTGVEGAGAEDVDTEDTDPEGQGAKGEGAEGQGADLLGVAHSDEVRPSGEGELLEQDRDDVRGDEAAPTGDPRVDAELSAVASPVGEDAPAIDDSPVFDDTPIFDDSPVFDDGPVFDGGPDFEDAPVFDDAPQADGSSPRDEATPVDDVPTVEELPAADHELFVPAAHAADSNLTGLDDGDTNTVSDEIPQAQTPDAPAAPIFLPVTDENPELEASEAFASADASDTVDALGTVNSARPSGLDHTAYDRDVEDDKPGDASVAETTEALQVEENAEDQEVHTTTIPVASSEDLIDYEPSATLPQDVLEARDADNPSTTMIRRDLMAPHEAEESAPAWETALAARGGATPARVPTTPTGETPESLSDAIFDGATVVPVVPSRTGAHIMSLIFGLLLIPGGWYLFADASARMLFPTDAPAVTGNVSWMALVEFAAALILWLVFVILTLRSSLGAWVWGVVLTIFGLPWLIIPGLTMSYTSPVFAWLNAHGGVVGKNFSHHVQLDAFAGRFMLMGVVLLAMATIAVSVRRRGRAEEALRARVEKVNPDGAFLTARERRRAAKAARSQN